MIFKLGRRIPLKAFLSTAVVLLMATSVAFLGNAVRSLQEADVIALHRWPDWPRAPIFLSQSLGYWPSRETITAQMALITVYAVGALYMFVLRPQLRRSTPTPVGGAGEGAAGVPADADSAVSVGSRS
jgi:high-affinity iron transporter